MTTDTMVDTRDMIVVHTALLEHHLAGGVGAHQHRNPTRDFLVGIPVPSMNGIASTPVTAPRGGLGAWAVTEMISLSSGRPWPAMAHMVQQRCKRQQRNGVADTLRVRPPASNAHGEQIA
jgi:hypothetical protein